MPSHDCRNHTSELLPHPGKAEIQFEHVSFRYPSRKQTTALDDITLDIASGESIALVGPSGAGKTTLFQLLLRFMMYRMAHSFQRAGYRQLSLHELRNKIAIVPQDSVIFSTNALENIGTDAPLPTMMK